MNYDVVVIGGGPGGYVSAIRSAQLGLKTACIEKRKTLGGTCLNVGCIPSKALLNSSEKFHEAQHEFAHHGVDVKPKLNLNAMMGRKNTVVDDLTKGIAYLFKKNGVDYIQGTGEITDPTTIAITDGDDSGKTITATNIIIATGSDSARPPIAGLDIDEKSIVTNVGALAFDSVPKHLVVIGGGVIGLELGSVWQRLGADVTVVEFAPNVLPTMDGDVSKTMKRLLKKQGMDLKLSTKVLSADKKGKAITLTVEGKTGEEKITCDKVLVAVGRTPYTNGLGLENVGVITDERGVIQVNGTFQTNVPNIYAIGDVIPGPMLAHKAEEEGVLCAEIIAGQKPTMNYALIPGVVYTHPEVASIGFTEEELKDTNTPYTVGKFNFTANSRAKANDTTDGFVKILSHGDTDKILGASIVGASAGESIHEIAAIMHKSGTAGDIRHLCHAHPTLAEAIKESALDADGRAIHA